MNTKEHLLPVCPQDGQAEGTSRRSFLHRAALTRAMGAAGLGTLLTLGSPKARVPAP
jgi:hypothetical protein